VPVAEATRVGVRRLFASIESRNLSAVADALAPDATWQNVPRPAAEGRQAVMAMLTPILCWSDVVRWDVLTEHYDGALGWVERLDRFEIAGAEHSVACNGIFTVGGDGRVAVVRDYADLGDWRARIGPVYEHMAARPAVAVVARHLAAVERRDPVAMAADYAPDAELERAGAVLAGRDEIAGYFATVPVRLTGRQLSCAPPRDDGAGTVVVDWQITGAGRADPVAAGSDRYRVEGGWIVSQTVTLDTADF
jgi:limonene-1,2-epoxide hydrolase